MTAQITATADPYYCFTNWSGDASGSADPLNLLMDAPKAVTANFAATPPMNYYTNPVAQMTDKWQFFRQKVRLAP